jgi:hypothetical protein
MPRPAVSTMRDLRLSSMRGRGPAPR